MANHSGQRPNVRDEPRRARVSSGADGSIAVLASPSTSPLSQNGFYHTHLGLGGHDAREAEANLAEQGRGGGP